MHVVRGGLYLEMRKGLAENGTFEKSLEGRVRGRHGVSRGRTFQARSGSVPAGTREGGRRGWSGGREAAEGRNEVGRRVTFSRSSPKEQGFWLKQH